MKLCEGEYCCRPVALPGDIHGAVMLTNDGSDFPNVYINDWLAPPARRRAFLHEMKHLENDDFYNDRSIEEVEKDNEEADPAHCSVCIFGVPLPITG